MTIDEAIAHANWVANSCEGECSENHRQLAEWLKELKQWQKLAEGIDLRPERLMNTFQPNDLERENDMLKAENDMLKAENDRLRDEIVRYVDLACILDREWNINVDWDGVRRIWYVGLTELGVRLRDEREAVRMAQVETINELVDKNEKLREMAAQALQTIKHVNVVMAIDYARYSTLMSMARELGVDA